MKRIYIIGLSLAGVLIIAFGVWRMVQQETLADLQKKYLLAQTEKEKSKVIDELIDYYLNLDVPDTLVENLNQEYVKLLAETSIDLTKYGNGIAASANPYALENDLKNLIRTTLVAYVRDENDNFQTLMSQAKVLAKVVDVGTDNHYWVPFVEGIAAYGKEQAEAWLKADLATGLCTKYQDSESLFEDAEGYGTLGLRFLQQADDERVRLDIIQRLQWILYSYRSMYELVDGLGQKSSIEANKIKYYARSNGFVYVQAEALVDISQNLDALSLYDKVIANAKAFANEWFLIRGLLGKGKVLGALGEYEKSLDLCTEVSSKQLNQKERMLLHMLRGNLYIDLGNYDMAEEELLNAIGLAEAESDTFNFIRSQNDLGVVFEHLGEYNRALDCYMKAKSLFSKSNLDASSRITILNNMADIAITTHDHTRFEEYNNEANRLNKSTNISFRKAELLRNTGSMYKLETKYRDAIELFRQADAIYSSNGYLRFGLITKIDLIDCLIGLSEFHEAKTLISDVEQLAEEINDVARFIDALDRLAKVQCIEGQIVEAVQTSNRLINEIEEMRVRFNNPDRWMSYRQKIFDFLKNAVFYEVALGRQDSAFVKLDYAKAYTMKSRFNDNRGDVSHPGFMKYVNIDSVRTNLAENSVLIDYMLTENELFAFVLDKEKLQLLSKPIKIDELKKVVFAYKDAIHRTIEFFQDYQPHKISSHYAETVRLARDLHSHLFAWPELEQRLQKTGLLYIIPDDFLYEIPFATLISRNSNSNTFVVNGSAVMTLPCSGFIKSEKKMQNAMEIKTKRVLISANRQFPGADRIVSHVKSSFPMAE